MTFVDGASIQKSWIHYHKIPSEQIDICGFVVLCNRKPETLIEMLH